MIKLFGYGEDAFTLWALKERISEILDKLNDRSKPLDCLKFFRPSFGRRSGKAVFGEFDAILSSLEGIYLIETKWDNFSKKGNRSDEIKLHKEQVLRHKIFSFYFMNWNAYPYSDWREFINTIQSDFTKNFPDRRIAPAESLLAQNLEYVLNKLSEHCKLHICKHDEPRNVLLYFYDKNKSKEIKRVASDGVNPNFEAVNIDYSQSILGNFIALD